MRPTLALALWGSFAACGDAAAPADASPGGDTPDVADTLDDAADAADGEGCDEGCEDAVRWSPCPLYYDGREGPAAECTSVEVPLAWSHPEGATIGIFVQRLRAPTQPARGQLWLLNGGPGGSGADFDDWMEALRELDPGLDLYAIDHRGTGRSRRLSCPEQESDTSDSGFYLTPAETGACYAAERAEWGDGLAELTTTAAARDLGHLIERTAVEGQAVFVYGVSYGTYWAHRYLQIFPAQATGVALDSLVPPTHDFVGYDRAYDAVGRDLMALCAADRGCADKLGADPMAAVADLFDAVVDGHCPALVDAWGIDPASLRLLLGILLTSPETRAYIPAVVYRLARCEAGDVDALSTLFELLFGGEAERSYYDTLGSDSIFYNVTLSELWPNTAPSLEAILDEQSTLYFSTGLTAEIAQATWTPYPDDAYVGAWADTAVPLLMLNGDLDPQTPLGPARALERHFTRPHQWFIPVPRAAHGVTVNTPVAAPERVPCGLELLLDFLADPEAEPDRACLRSIPAVSFDGDPALNELVFGTPDAWDNIDR